MLRTIIENDGKLVLGGFKTAGAYATGMGVTKNEATGVAPIRQSLTIPPAQPTVIANTITPKKSRRFLTPLTAPVIANITVPKMSKAYIHSFSITKE